MRVVVVVVVVVDVPCRISRVVPTGEKTLLSFFFANVLSHS